MERLVSKRRSLRCWGTRYANEVENVVQVANWDRLTELVVLLEGKIRAIEILDGQIADVVPDEEMEHEIMAAEEYIDGLRSTLVRAKRHLNLRVSTSSRPSLSSNSEAENGGSQNVLELEQSSEKDGRDARDEGNNSENGVVIVEKSQEKTKEADTKMATVDRANYKLPKLIISKYKGDVGQWQGFFDAFSSAVDKHPFLSNVQKFTYLRSYLEGPAAASIAGLQLSDVNYDVAVKILKERFGRSEVIINNYMQKLLNVTPVRKVTEVQSLRNAFDTVESLVRGLESLGVTTQTYGNLLSPVILKIIPEEMVVAYNREVKESDIFDVEKILEFWKKELFARERSQQLARDRPAKMEKNVEEADEGLARMTAAALTIASNKPLKCLFCAGGHFTHRCGKKMDIESRRESIIKAKACFLCLRMGHQVKDCRLKNLKCNDCGRKHNTLLCNKSKSSEQNTVTVGLQMASPSVRLQIIKAKAVVNGKELEIRCMLDTGSDRSFVRESVVKRLGLSPICQDTFSVQAFGGATQSKQFHLYELEIMGMNGKDVCRINAYATKGICHVRSAAVESEILKRLQSSELDLSLTDLNGEVDLLIGSDFYWTLVTGEIRRLSDALVAVETKIGWLLTGPTREKREPLTCMLNVDSWPIEELWKLETMGITDEKQQKENEYWLEKLNVTKLESGRYKVGLMWKNEERPASNYDQAKKRLLSQFKRLQRTSLVEDYEAIISQQIADGIVKKISGEVDKLLYFMPHKAVVSEGKTTKVRMVFDASANTERSKSLNDCLDSGPNMIADFLKILLRFRTFKVGIVADIRKAYHQIAVNEKDQMYQNFLWFSDWKQSMELSTFRFLRVVFGVTCSPFALNAVLQMHLKTSNDFKWKTLVANSLYVDDLVCGTNNVDEAKDFVNESAACLSEAGMLLHKWGTNDLNLKTELKEQKLTADVSLNEVNVLGLTWDTNSDTLCVQLENIRKMRDSFQWTKRGLLTLFASIFDPCGFLSPFVITLKIVFQQLWKKKVEWDEVLQADDVKILKSWWTQLSTVNVRVPRWFGAIESDTEIHIFCDASEKAMSVAAYVQTSNGVFLVFAKARLVPLKQISIPRLELTAAVMGSKVKQYLQECFRIDNNQFHLWTDSKVVLSWIKTSPADWRCYVKNRLSLILELTDGAKWRHVAGKKNPADLGTRGISGEALVSSSLWWNGPNLGEILEESTTEMDTQKFEEEIKSKERKTTAVVFPVSTSWMPSFRSLKKAKRVVDIVLRFVLLCKKERSDVDKYQDPLVVIILEAQREIFGVEIECLNRKSPLPKTSKLIQFTPFLDKQGVLRMYGRLQDSHLTYDEKHPILLSSEMEFSTLLIKEIHESCFHSGVQMILNKLREKYWLLGARRLVKKILGSCVICKKVRGKPFDTQEAPLPEERIVGARAFQNIGLNFAGPLYVKAEGGPRKNYILLITCCSSRAVHLEVVTSMSTDSFVLAFKRFVSRRGLPSVVYSDNALTFHKANRDFQLLFKASVGSKSKEYMQEKGIVWKFSVPRAPWWGGFWERMVQTVKNCLKASLRKEFVDTEYLSTLLCEIEAVVNSRPLMSTGVSAEEAITPAHLILGSRLSRIPDDGIKQVDNLGESFKALKETLNRFWSRWKKEYVLNLSSFHRVRRQGRKLIQKDEVVLVVDEKVPRMQWKLGRISEIHFGRDGQVRSCTVKLGNGMELKRPIQLLVPLEVNSDLVGGENVVTTMQVQVSREKSLIVNRTEDRLKKELSQ